MRAVGEVGRADGHGRGCLVVGSAVGDCDRKYARTLPVGVCAVGELHIVCAVHIEKLVVQLGKLDLRGVIHHRTARGRERGGTGGLVDRAVGHHDQFLDAGRVEVKHTLDGLVGSAGNIGGH